MARLLWIWGWPAARWFLSSPAMRGCGAAPLPALAWMGIALVPYSFLTYSTQIPSRQVYLASAGLALLVGLALAQYAKDAGSPPWCSAVMLLHNTVYLWTKKRATIRGAGGAHGAVDPFRAKHSGSDLGTVFPAAGDRRGRGGAAGDGPFALGSGVERGCGAGTLRRGVLLSRISDDAGIFQRFRLIFTFCSPTIVAGSFDGTDQTAKTGAGFHREFCGREWLLPEL